MEAEKRPQLRVLGPEELTLDEELAHGRQAVSELEHLSFHGDLEAMRDEAVDDAVLRYASAFTRAMEEGRGDLIEAELGNDAELRLASLDDLEGPSELDLVVIEPFFRVLETDPESLSL